VLFFLLEIHRLRVNGETMSDKTSATLRRVLHHAETYLSGLDDRPVAATVGVEKLRERIGVELKSDGTEPDQVIDELVAATAGGLLGCAGGRFFAWVIGGSLPSAIAADWLTSTWDQNAALGACGPAVAVIEEVAGAWLKELLGLPDQASFAFTTGCQLAHFTALAAARHAVLRDASWNVNEEGLFGAPQVRVITSDCRHGSIDRAVRFLGFGTKNLVAVDSDDSGRVIPRALESTLEKSDTPTIVVLDAADLNIAAFDSFKTLIPIAKAAGAWVHVDGAFGLIARASRSKRRLLDGVEDADSWATDGHKWLNVPFDCGIVFVRDAEAHREAMTVSASYIATEGQLRDQIDWNPEWSRRGRAVSVYAALRELGRAGLEDLIDRTCAHADKLVSGIGTLPGTEVLWRPGLNQGLVRFLDSRADASDRDHDRKTIAVMDAINRTGEAFFSGTSWRGKQAMRVSVVNWRTSEADIARAVMAIRNVLVSLN
jgi:glutamate/tyrosine decarboxylase-like PLP-dependent enzyme